VSTVSAHFEVLASQNVVHVSLTSHAVPALLQVSTLSPLQRFAPGVHAPVHKPAAHETAHVAE
jgi:hypothetical protein